MGTLDKLIAELLRDPPPREMAYRDIARVLEAHSWVEREAAGSHIRWRKQGHLPVTISLHGNRRSGIVSRASLRDVIEAITDQRRIR